MIDTCLQFNESVLQNSSKAASETARILPSNKSNTSTPEIAPWMMTASGFSCVFFVFVLMNGEIGKEKKKEEKEERV